MTDSAELPNLTIGDTFVDAPCGVIESMLMLFFKDNPSGTFGLGSVEGEFYTSANRATHGEPSYDVPLDERGTLAEKVWDTVKTLSDARQLVEGRIIVGDLDNAIEELQTLLPQCDFVLSGSREACSATLQIKPSLAVVPPNRREHLHCTLEASMAATLREVVARALEVGAFGCSPVLPGA